MDLEKDLLEILQNMAMMKLVEQLKWNEEFDDETRGIINRYLQMHHDLIGQEKKLEFTAVDGLMMAGLLETVMHYRKVAEDAHEEIRRLHKLFGGAF